MQRKCKNPIERMKREFILTPQREDFIQTESNEVHFNCRGAAFLLQRKCKPSAMKFTSIAEVQPFFYKDTLFY